MSIKNTPIFEHAFQNLRYLGLGSFSDLKKPKESNFLNIWYKIYSFLIIATFGYGFYICQILATFFIKSNYAKLIDNLLFILPHTPTMFKIIIFFKKSSEIREICFVLQESVKFFRQNPIKTNQGVSNAKRVSKFLNFSVIFCTFLTSFSKNGKNGLPFEVYIPWSVNGSFGFICAWAYQVFGILICGFFMFSMDILIISIIMQLTIQFQILQNSFETLLKGGTDS